jgi:hypothetical protein
MEIAFKQLSECPEHLETVGLWIYNQWCTRNWMLFRIASSPWLRENLLEVAA